MEAALEELSPTLARIYHDALEIANREPDTLGDNFRLAAAIERTFRIYFEEKHRDSIH
jgi:hypothetical protein